MNHRPFCKSDADVPDTARAVGVNHPELRWSTPHRCVPMQGQPVVDRPPAVTHTQLHHRVRDVVPVALVRT
jgi:hypothetical protein